MPSPVSRRTSSRSPASTTAVPSTGWPANGSSAAGVKMRMRASPPSRLGSSNTVSERFSSRATRGIVASSMPAASEKTASALPSSGVSVKTSAMT